MKKMSEGELRLLGEQRLIASAVAGTDICVSGGPFACSCNACMERRMKYGQALLEELDKVFLKD